MVNCRQVIPNSRSNTTFSSSCNTAHVNNLLNKIIISITHLPFLLLYLPVYKQMVAMHVHTLHSYLLLRHLPDHKPTSSCYLVSWIQDLESNSQFPLFPLGNHLRDSYDLRIASSLVPEAH